MVLLLADTQEVVVVAPALQEVMRQIRPMAEQVVLDTNHQLAALLPITVGVVVVAFGDLLMQQAVLVAVEQVLQQASAQVVQLILVAEVVVVVLMLVRALADRVVAV
jgi:hypothetical protein